MSWYDEFLLWLPGLIVFFDLLLIGIFSAWILMTKPDSTSAVAWCLLIILLPFLGAVMFLLFGYQHVNRPLRRKRLHRQRYQFPIAGRQPGSGSFRRDQQEKQDATLSEGLTRLADRFGAYPLTQGNQIDFYFDGKPAFEAMLEAVRQARHHIHVQSFIIHADELGCQFLDELTRKAKEGVQVRLLYDAMGSLHFRPHSVQALKSAGGKCSVFMPVNLLRRRFQVNLRNHRKVFIVDGKTGFTGGLNIGDEYLGKNPRFGYWRDTHMRLRGPAVNDLQRVFCEDWDFAAGENLQADAERSKLYFAGEENSGPYPVQVIDSGPDRDLKGIREIYFAAIIRARRRVWIASPYFVPDTGLLDALRLAGHLGLDVRFLGQFYPDKWVPQFAARYYWDNVLQAGVKIYQYAKGMMHSKVVIVDDEWASVGTANLDNRSLFLNFEVNGLIHSPQAAQQLEEAFLRDLQDSIRLERNAFARRPYAARLLENACRLLSPVL